MMFYQRFTAAKYLVVVFVFSSYLQGGMNMRVQTQFLQADTTHRYLSSPSYGVNDYNNNEQQGWLIKTSQHDSTIVIEILYIDLEGSQGCCIDVLEVFDGDEWYKDSLGRYCKLTATIKSTHDEVFLWFRTDATNTARGFQLKYYEKPIEESRVWKTAVIGILVGIAVLGIFAMCCFCAKKHKIIQRDSSVNPEHTSNQLTATSRRDNNHGRVSRPRVWATEVQQANYESFVVRANRHNRQNNKTKQKPEQVNPPDYEEIDVSPGKLPTYDDIIEEEYARFGSPPPLYVEHFQHQRQDSPVPASSSPPLQTSLSTSLPSDRGTHSPSRPGE